MTRDREHLSGRVKRNTAERRRGDFVDESCSAKSAQCLSCKPATDTGGKKESTALDDTARGGNGARAKRTSLDSQLKLRPKPKGTTASPLYYNGRGKARQQGQSGSVRAEDAAPAGEIKGVPHEAVRPTWIRAVNNSAQEVRVLVAARGGSRQAGLSFLSVLPRLAKPEGQQGRKHSPEGATSPVGCRAVRPHKRAFPWSHSKIEDGDLVLIGRIVKRLHGPASWRHLAIEELSNSENGD